MGDLADERAEGEGSSSRGRGLRFAVALVPVMVALVFGVVWLQRSLLFPRTMVRPVPGALATPGLERLWIDSDEGRVEAWMLPGEGVTPEAPGPAVLFFHGNGELIDHWPDALRHYRELGVSVVLPEYRGYGRSAGSPSETSIEADMRQVLARVTAHPMVDDTRLVYHGRSLGGGVAASLLAHQPPRALVVESTFTSVPEVASWAPSFLIVDRFESRPRFAAYDGPMLLFHGVRDQVVPVEHAHQNRDAHPGSRLVLYDCGHNDLPPAGTDYWVQIERHLRAAGVLTP